MKGAPKVPSGADSSVTGGQPAAADVHTDGAEAEVEWVDGYENMVAKELDAGSDSEQDEWQLPADADDLSPDVLGSLPAHIRKSMIEDARRKLRNKSRAHYLPVAGNPALYSQTQLSNFLNSR
jgi:hypothetical protein